MREACQFALASSDRMFLWSAAHGQVVLGCGQLVAHSVSQNAGEAGAQCFSVETNGPWSDGHELHLRPISSHLVTSILPPAFLRVVLQRRVAKGRR